IRQKEERLMAGELWNDTGFVCTSPDGKPLDPDWVTHAFKKVIEKLGITPVTFHGLRHTHATLLLTQNVHPKVVSERLGHSTVGMTLDTYSHVIPNMQKEAALKIDQILRAASSKQERS
ncbi:MAG TPA: site-specific integrase, partial [Clostridia bacterium]|nr:site-specific integrase [Clostridia bacterium]